MLPGARAGTQGRRGYHAAPASQTPDPRQTGAPTHAADAPGRQGGSRFLARRQADRAGRRNWANRSPSPAHCHSRDLDTPPTQTHTPWGASSSSPPAHSPRHACTLTRARPRPASEPPAPFPRPAPARGVPRRTHAPQTHPVQRRRAGAAGAAAAQTRRLREVGKSERASGLLPSGPHLPGSRRLQGAGEESGGATVSTCQQCGCGAAHAGSVGQSGTSLPAPAGWAGPRLRNFAGLLVVPSLQPAPGVGAGGRRWGRSFTVRGP